MPERSAIEKALDRILAATAAEEVTLDARLDRYAVFSDHHKGRRDGADDFQRCEGAYLAALEHYHREGYSLVVLGDAEELWENTVTPVLRAYWNVLAAERRFHPDRYVKIWGNHDDEWEAPHRVRRHLHTVFGPITVREGLQLRVTLDGRPLGSMLMLHGHQGTLLNDRLKGIAKLAIRYLWRSIQRVTRRPSTTPATDACLRDAHDRAMYEWASRHRRLVLIAGHTHRPVFSSQTHLQQLLDQLVALETRAASDPHLTPTLTELRERIAEVRSRSEECEQAFPEGADRPRPCYFNAGCCSFADGDVTGIELADGEIRLVRWGTEGDRMGRRLLATAQLERVFNEL